MCLLIVVCVLMVGFVVVFWCCVLRRICCVSGRLVGAFVVGCLLLVLGLLIR